MKLRKIIDHFSIPSAKVAKFADKDNKSSSQSIWDNSMEQYQKGNFKTYWELLPPVAEYQMKCMTGDQNVHYLTYTLDYIKEKFIGENVKGLFLGCMEGNPGPEMRAMETGLFTGIDVMDIAEGLLNKQYMISLQNKLDGIKYIQQDFNKVMLKVNEYDVIWAIGTVHHVENLEHFFDQIKNALKKNGIFIMREYIGPNRMQFTDVQLNIVNDILSILPDRYKRNPDGFIKNNTKKPDLKELIKKDPSESIRSQEIISVMEKNLVVVHLAYTGGTILHPLLDDIASNFERDKDAETILKLLILLEKNLIEAKVLQSDYVFCIAKKSI